jgi:hypothetical protein
LCVLRCRNRSRRRHHWTHHTKLTAAEPRLTSLKTQNWDHRTSRSVQDRSEPRLIRRTATGRFPSPLLPRANDLTPLVIDAARSCRRRVGDRWFVDETYVKVAEVWRCVCRAVDQHGQVIDVCVSKRPNIASARMFFTTMLNAHGRPEDVTNDLAAPLVHVVDELIVVAWPSIDTQRASRAHRPTKTTEPFAEPTFT